MMNLEDLRRRIEHEEGAEQDGRPVRIMIPGGRRFEILSLNWNDEEDEWVLIGETL